jgi:hypothetical protein
MVTARQHALDEIAAQQHDAWTLAQALDCGFTRPAVRRRLSSRLWQEIDARVYRVGLPTPLGHQQALHARVLATGGVASGRSAGALYGWMSFPAAPDVTVVRAARRDSHRGVHVTDSLPARDLRVIDGIRATSPIRTLIDLGGRLQRAHYEDLFDAVLASGAVPFRTLERRARELHARGEPDARTCCGSSPRRIQR